MAYLHAEDLEAEVHPAWDRVESDSFEVLQSLDEFEEYAFVDRTLEDNYCAGIKKHLNEEEALLGNTLPEWYDEDSESETDEEPSTPLSTAVEIGDSDVDFLALELINQLPPSNLTDLHISQGP